MRHVLYSQQFDRSILDTLFRRAGEFRRRMAVPSEKAALTQLHRGKTLFSVFYEPSTRTRMSFGAAGDDIKDHLREKGVAFTEESCLEDALPQSDVVYWTRVQKERLGPESVYEELHAQFVIGKAQLDLMKPHAVLMHPLPRLEEIPPEIDPDPRAWYFRQAGNGMFIRMSLLEWIFESD